MDWLLSRVGLSAQPAAFDRVLVVVVMLVAVLFVLSVVFAFGVVLLRARHVHRRKRAQTLSEQWHERLLDVLAGVAPVTAMHERVKPGDELELLAFLMQFARRLRGDEARTLAHIAAPYLERAADELTARSPERRALAVQALAAFGMSAHGARVLLALDDRSPYVAMTAAQALARREHDAYAGQVMRRLWRFVDWSNDYLGAMLARIGPAAAEHARRILGDPVEPDHARAVAAGVLRRLNDSHAANVAAQVLAGEVPPETAAAALRLLAQVGRAEHLDAARGHTNSPNGLVRAEAIRAIAALGGETEVAVLTRALEDPSQWVVHEAARGLAQLGRLDVLRRLAADGGPLSVVARQVMQDAALPAGGMSA